MESPARRYTVHGRVQGVFFRDSTRRQAERLGVSGHAINRPDGTVEVLAAGSASAPASAGSSAGSTKVRPCRE